MVALIVILGIATAGACGSKGTTLYDAKATRRCLADRPEYRTIDALGINPATHLPDNRRVEWSVLHATPFPNGGSEDPDRGHGSKILTELTGPVTRGWRSEASNTALLFFFDDPTDAHFWHESQLAVARRVLPKIAPMTLELDRNVYLIWGDGYKVPTRHVHSIVHGCLRTR